MRALVVVVTLGFVALDVSGAQSAPDSSATPGCQRSGAAATTYARCSLQLEGDRLLVRASGEPIAHAEGLRPVALSRFVIGDSARRYALSYERDARRQLWLRLAAGTMMLGASVSMLTRPRCACASFLGRHPCPAVEGVLYGGMAVNLASVLFKWRAEEEGMWALVWHNRALTH